MANENFLERNERLIQAQYRIIEEIRESEERSRSLIASLPQQIWTTLPNGTLDYANQQMCLYLNRTLEDLLESGWADCIHPDDKPKYDALYAKGVKLSKPYEIDIRLRNSAGIYRWHFTKVIPLRSEAGVILNGWVAIQILLNVNKQKRLCV